VSEARVATLRFTNFRDSLVKSGLRVRTAPELHAASDEEASGTDAFEGTSKATSRVAIETWLCLSGVNELFGFFI
jgi:hypothetical protein